MAKFNFDNSRYARFFADAGNMNFLQTFIDETGVFRYDAAWWKTQMTVKSENIPTDADGVASYAVKVKELEAPVMMDMRAPLGDSQQLDTKGFTWYTGSIPDFISPGIVETATQRMYKQKQFEQFGRDADIVMAWTEEMESRVVGAHSTLTNMTAQIISNGVIQYQYGRGIQEQYLANARIPAANKVTAGAEVWTDADCKILSQMAQIEYDWRQSGKVPENASLKWQMDWNMFYNVLLKNAEVIDNIKQYRELNEQFITDSMTVTEEMFRAAIAGFPGISPIEIVSEWQMNITNDGQSTVKGWNGNHVVLRPTGYAGEIFKTDTIDQYMAENYGASSVSTVFASLESGLMTMFNTTVDNGRYKEWHSDLIMSAVPTLGKAPYHLIVDTTVADS